MRELYSTAIKDILATVATNQQWQSRLVSVSVVGTTKDRWRRVKECVKPAQGNNGAAESVDQIPRFNQGLGLLQH